MPIFVERATRVICQGTLSDEEAHHIYQCMLYGTQVVAFVKAGCGGSEKLGLPVFDSMREARWQTRASHSLVFVDSQHGADAIEEAVEAGIGTIICCTSGLPLHDMVEIHYVLSKNPKSRLIGPGSCGLITPSQCKAGVMPGYVFAPGSVGIVTSADTVGYEAAWQLTQAGFGQTTFVGIGDAALRGTSVVDVLNEFEQDVATEIVLMIVQNGETGVDAVVEWNEKGKRKPLLAVVVGHTMPKSKSVLSVTPLGGNSGDAADVLRKAGVLVIEDISLISTVVEQVLSQIRFME
jgi:succinyl-CoA synthetase alpha subunit